MTGILNNLLKFSSKSLIFSLFLISLSLSLSIREISEFEKNYISGESLEVTKKDQNIQNNIKRVN